MEGHANVWDEMSRPARYAEIEALPDNMVGQIVDGELVALPRPSGEHTVAADVLGTLLRAELQLRAADGARPGRACRRAGARPRAALARRRGLRSWRCGWGPMRTAASSRTKHPVEARAPLERGRSSPRGAIVEVRL